MNPYEPTFKIVFGNTWQTLPPVFQKRYQNRSFSQDKASVTGAMDIRYSKIMALFMPFFRLLHALAPCTGNQVPTTVDFCSHPNSSAVHLNRIFYFPNKKPYAFDSKMYAIKEQEVIEVMSLGIGWRMQYLYDGCKIIMRHKGYVWKIGNFYLPLPLAFLLGKGHAEETAIDDNRFRVTMTMTHGLFGMMYQYIGNFTFCNI